MSARACCRSTCSSATPQGSACSADPTDTSLWFEWRRFPVRPAGHVGARSWRDDGCNESIRDNGRHRLACGEVRRAKYRLEDRNKNWVKLDGEGMQEATKQQTANSKVAPPQSRLDRRFRRYEIYYHLSGQLL